MSIFKEFKAFAMRGNVVDMAVGVIIGGAFGKIVTSMVSDLLMPVIGKLLGGVDFKDLYLSLDPAKSQGMHSIAKVREAGVAVIAYGQFLNVLIDFLIVAFCIFIAIKAMNVLTALNQKSEKIVDPTTKNCPHCISVISIKATKCAHCASVVS
jgi:large conductance mechanosensitive channel